jgi:hypothetical protein
MSRLVAASIALVLVVQTSIAFAAFDQRLIVGEWASYSSSWFHGPSYAYLRLDDKLNGLYAYAYNGDKPLILPFMASDVVAADGYITINLKRNEGAPFKLVLSAFRGQSDATSLATGVLYMYQGSADQLRLINTLYVRLMPVLAADLDSKAEIQQLRKTK